MIGVIADDLTGAAEIGAVGLRHGLGAEVLLAGEPCGDADLVCVDTDSRSCAPREAAERAGRAASRLQRQQAGWVYKKTDSVLRGNVTPEIEAIVAELGLNGALLVPANPALGRTITDGRYYVRGQLINETEFARDPSHPRLSSNVCQLLDEPAVLPLWVRRPEEGLPERGMVIGEARSTDDLCRWAGLRHDRWLLAGGAEFFGALLTPAAPIAPGSHVPGKELFVCGSASASTRKFVSDQAQCGVPVLSLPEKVLRAQPLDHNEIDSLADKAVGKLREKPRVILQIGLSQVNNAMTARMLVGHLVQVAEAVLRRAEVGLVFAEGGETAVALARCMGWSRLKVVAELTPGVVRLSVSDGGPPFVLTIKPGSYLWPASLLHT